MSRIWRGFNYPACWYGPGPVRKSEEPKEDDFSLAANWGFNFIRIPVHHLFFEKEELPGSYMEERLIYIDKAIEWCRKLGLHANLDMHFLPGYGITHLIHQIPITLWTSEEMLRRAENIWRMLAERYSAMGDFLSFNLINEPAGVDMKTYVKFVKRMVKAIREIDPDRIIIVDGINVSRTPVYGLEDEELLLQSFHFYEPMWMTHLKASWAHGPDVYEEIPTYPGEPPNMDNYLAEYARDPRRRGFFIRYRNVHVDKNWIENKIMPWVEFREKTGTTIHCGELGIFPVRVDRVSMLNWYRDLLDVLESYGIGWALWNLRGPFGIIETGREEFLTERLPNGDRLDGELLRLLRSYL
jgi:endoglucanase